MNENQVISLVGLIIVFIGIFCPIISAPLVGNLTYFGNGQGDGAIVLGLAIVALICVFINSNKGSIILGTIILSMIFSALITFQFSAGNNNLIQLQWGWALLVVGSILLLVGASEKKMTLCAISIIVSIALGSGISYFGTTVKVKRPSNIIKARIGDEIMLKTVKFSISSWEESKQVKRIGGAIINAKPNSKFIVINLSITNTEKNAIDTGAGFLILVDNQKRQFLSYSDNLFIENVITFKKLSPGIPYNGIYVFEVPSTAYNFYVMAVKKGTNDAYRIDLL